MAHHRLAIVRQKYRPDGGAERFVSRALTALSNQNLELNVITREWQGEKQDDCGSRSSLILCKVTSEFLAATFTARGMASIVAGCYSARVFSPAGVRRC